MPSTFFEFRRRSAFALAAILFFAAFAFGATDPWAFAVVAGGIFGLSLWWAVRFLRGPYRVALSWFCLPLALVPAAAALQLMLGRTASPHRTAGELGWWLVYFVFFALLVNVLEDVTLRRTVQRHLAYLGGAVSAAAIVQWLVSPRAAYGFRVAPGAEVFGPFADAESFAFLVELLLPGALMLAFRDGERKVSLFLSCVLMVAGIAFSGSAAGQVIVAGELVLALAVSGYTAARSMSRRRWARQAALSAAGALAVTAIVVVGVAAGEAQARLDPADFPGRAAFERGDVMRASWRLFQQAPVLGHGLGAFGAVFASAVPRRDSFHWEHGAADPLELAVELGAAGIAVQALLLTMILGARRDLRTWTSVILPLAVVWAHSWAGSPLRTPALVLVALALLALLPAAEGPLRRPRAN